MTSVENERYQRQLIIPGWTRTHQQRLRDSHVGVIGAGGLGSPVALYLCAAGVGRLTVCDYQDVELSNLNRQILYTTDDIDSSKAVKAAQRLRALNPDVSIQGVNEAVNTKNIDTHLGTCHLLVDCLDNFETRLLLNRFSWTKGTPLLHGGISEFYGQIYLSVPPKTPCLACLLPSTTPSTMGPVPVAGPVAGVVGSLQAVEALKYLGQMVDVEPGVLRLVDLVTMQLESIPLKRKRCCAVCSKETGSGRSGRPEPVNQLDE